MAIRPKQELKWLIHQAQRCQDKYMLEHLLPYKDYSTAQVHKWGKNKLYTELYQILLDRLAQNLDAVNRKPQEPQEPQEVTHIIKVDNILERKLDAFMQIYEKENRVYPKRPFLARLLNYRIF